MSKTVMLRPNNFIPYTLIPNFFIDGFLGKANGEFVKVYLVLLRYMSIGQFDFTLSHIADHLLMTESDVLRALNYFQDEQLLSLSYEGNRLSEIHLSHLPSDGSDPSQVSRDTKASYGNYQTSTESFNSDGYKMKGNVYDNRYPANHESIYSSEPSQSYGRESIYDNRDQDYDNSYGQANKAYYQEKPSPQPEYPSREHLKVISSKPEYTNKEIAYYSEKEDFHQLLYITQKYLGKTLSNTEVKTIISFHDWLGLPIDVIELLIEYCVGNDHRNMRYIEKVAIDWADNNINTIEKAKVRTETYNKSYFVILKAYGITDRSPTPNQIKLMDKWLNEYQLDISLIVEACQRTIAQINKAEMRYTDSILNTWFKEKVHTIKEVALLDEKRPKATYNKKPNMTKQASKFNNYQQRDYDYDELEKKALELRLRESGGKRYSS